MINGSAQYATAGAFRRALDERLQREARAQGRPAEEVRREFLFQRFLTLMFAQPNEHWLLKGGASLLLRLDRARFSKDLDLLRQGELDAKQAIAELRDLAAPQDGDYLTFVVEDGITYSGATPVVTIKVTAYIGARYGTFPIDLSRELTMVAAPERIKPIPIIELPGLADPPKVTVYPLADQVADKVCAMYEVHGDGGHASSRFRDLIDLALIIRSCDLDSANVLRALKSESGRRQLELPTTMTSPGPLWPAGYNAYARKARVSADIQNMDAALELVKGCPDPILNGHRTNGSWTPAKGWAGPAAADTQPG